MASISKAKDPGIRSLDTRVLPEWHLLDLTETKQDYEEQFAESVMSEFTDIAGFDIEYYVYDPKSVDVFYGEATKSDLDGPYRTKLLMEPFKEPYLINVFGFVGDQKIEVAEMPKAIFLRDVQEQVNKKYDLDFDPEELQPKVGDVIHCLWNDERYEITNVNSAEKVFQGRKHIWSFTMKPYRIGNEGAAETELLAAEVDLADFDDRNETYKKITLKQANKEKKTINKLANKTPNDSEVDSSYYGYTTGIKS